MVFDAKVSLGFFAIVYLAALIIVIIQSLSGINLGVIGFVSWGIVIVSTIAFFIYLVLIFLERLY